MADGDKRHPQDPPSHPSWPPGGFLMDLFGAASPHPPFRTRATPSARYLAGPYVRRECLTSLTLAAAFRIEVARRQRHSDCTVSLEGTRFKIPAAYRYQGPGTPALHPLGSDLRQSGQYPQQCHPVSSPATGQIRQCRQPAPGTHENPRVGGYIPPLVTTIFHLVNNSLQARGAHAMYLYLMQ